FELGLQGTVIGVAAGIAMDCDSFTTACGAIAELRKFLEGYPQRHSGLTIIDVCRGLNGRPLIGHHGVDECMLIARDGAEIELVQIHSAKREEQAPAAYISGGEVETMREIG